MGEPSDFLQGKLDQTWISMIILSCVKKCLSDIHLKGHSTNFMHTDKNIGHEEYYLDQSAEL